MERDNEMGVAPGAADAGTGGGAERRDVGLDQRRPYEPPVLESGVAFERVLLMSGCNSGFFCPVPC